MTDSMDECRAHIAEMRAEREGGTMTDSRWGWKADEFTMWDSPEDAARMARRNVQSRLRKLTFDGVPVAELLLESRDTVVSWAMQTEIDRAPAELTARHDLCADLLLALFND